MNQAANATATQATIAIATAPALPRRPRIGSAIASVVVTCGVFASVVLGMTATGPGTEQMLAQGHFAART